MTDELMSLEELNKLENYSPIMSVSRIVIGRAIKTARQAHTLKKDNEWSLKLSSFLAEKNTKLEAENAELKAERDALKAENAELKRKISQMQLAYKGTKL